MRILFMGTPEFARTALWEIQKAYPGEIVGVITRQDTPKNRGHIMTPPPVKTAALELSIPVYQPVNLKKENFADILQEMNPDIIVVVAYGKLLPPYVLEYPRFGCINIHGSILPKYRGAAPIQRAILAGEKEMGVTIIKMAEGLDTGDMYAKATMDSSTGNFEEIHDRLADLGGKLVVETMKKIFDGTAVAEPQDDALSTYASKIEKADRILDFSQPAEIIINKIRTFAPTPGAETKLPSGKVKITSAIRLDEAPEGEPGTVAALSAKGLGLLTVNTVDAKIKIERLIPEGKKEMSAGDFIRGRRITQTDRFE
ncbi:MAG: methionyl-tRNA formyltransferase [Ruminococcaceae bacterium]|nr:methionyl-tRNA formyltransferase [Oscillospiraceae bacterium]